MTLVSPWTTIKPSLAIKWATDSSAAAVPVSAVNNAAIAKSLAVAETIIFPVFFMGDPCAHCVQKLDKEVILTR